MNPTILIPCGEPGRDGEARGQILTVPCAAARANQNSHRERNGAKVSSAICHGPVFSVKRTVRAIIENVVAPGSVPDADTIKAVRIPNSRQPFGAGNRIPGSTRIEALQKSSHVRCPFTHFGNSRVSLQDAHAPFQQHRRRDRVCPTIEFPGAEIEFPKKT